MDGMDRLWWGVMACICLIVTLPLLGDYGLTLFPLGRDVIFRLLTETMLILYLFLIYKDGSFRPRFSALTWALTAFAFWSGLAVLFSSQPLFSFFGNPFRGHGYLSWLHLLLFFIVVKSFLKRAEERRLVYWLVVSVSFLVGAVALLERLGGANRVQSTLNNPNFFSAYLLFPFFLTIGLLFEKKRPFLLEGEGMGVKAFLIVTGLLSVWGVYLSGSRGAYVGLGAGVFVFLFLYLWRILEKRRAILLLAFVLLAGTAGWVVREEAVDLYGTLTGPIEEIEGRGRSIKQRVESYRTALLGMKERPLLGYGPENFTVAFDRFYSGSLESTGYSWFDKVHNIFLETGVTVGVPGLFVFLSIFFFAFRNVWPADSFLKIAVFSALVAYLAQDMFNIDSTVSFIYLHLFLAFTEHLRERV